MIAQVPLAGALVALPALGRAHEAGATAPFDTATGIAVLALALAAWLYGLGYARSPALRRRHALAFLGGWFTIAVALVSPLDQAAGRSFVLHMVQHELLMLVAPPLLILGRPFAALAVSVPPRVLRMAAWPLAMPPLAAWTLHAVALWTWHVPRLFDAGAVSDAVHALQHACFFWSALLFWWTVFRRVSSGAAVLYLLTTLIHSGTLAALLTFAPTPLYAGASLEQQQLGGLIMWVPAGYALLLAGLLAFHRLLRPHEA
jgi:putative membrane protein